MNGYGAGWHSRLLQDQHRKERRLAIPKPPKSVILTAVFIAVDSVLWLLFVILAAVTRSYLSSLPALYKWGIVLSALGGSLALAAICFLLLKRNRFGFYLGLLVLTVIAVASLMDELGFLDLLAFLLILVPLVLLLHDRNWYLKPSPN